MEPIRSRVVEIEAMLSGNYFRPAAVQREYQWTTDQCSALLSDFVRAWTLNNPADLKTGTSPAGPVFGERPLAPYFLGSFVLQPEGDTAFQVFDGLQRLTTLTILFAVMRDLVEGHDPALHARLSLMVLDVEGQPHLKAGGADQTLANLIQKHSEAVRLRRNLSANTLRARLLSAAGLFRSRLADWSPEALAGFADYVLRNVLVGIVEVRDERLARQIFITTNNRGVPLNEADVLKSQINSIPFRQDIADRVLSGWNRIRDSFESDSDYTDFLYAVDFLTRRQGRSSEGLTELGEHLASVLDDDQIVFWIDEFEDRAISWHWLSAIREDPRKADPTKGDIFQLFAFEWPEWRPVALELAGQLRRAIGAKDRRKIKLLSARFSALHRACAAMVLEELGEMERVQILLRTLGDVQAGRNPATHSLALTDERLTAISRLLGAPVYETGPVRQVLRWLAAAEPCRDAASLLAMTPQQVLPARTEEFTDWEKDFPSGDARWLLAHAWGNYALLPVASRGEDIVPDGFREWKKQMPKDAGKLAVNASLAKAHHWSPSDIERRTNELRSKILDQLRIQDGP